MSNSKFLTEQELSGGQRSNSSDHGAGKISPTPARPTQITAADQILDLNYSNVIPD